MTVQLLLVTTAIVDALLTPVRPRVQPTGPCTQRSPAFRHLKNYLKHLKFVEGRNILMYTDFHGHSRRKNIFIYGCSSKGGKTAPSGNLLERIFPKLLSYVTPPPIVIGRLARLRASLSLALGLPAITRGQCLQRKDNSEGAWHHMNFRPGLQPPQGSIRLAIHRRRTGK